MTLQDLAVVSFSGVLGLAYLVCGVSAVKFLARCLPALGPGRALSLALRSSFTQQGTPSSRTPEVQRLRRQIASRQPDHVTTVSGPRGCGKSLIIATALAGEFGVVVVPVDKASKYSFEVVRSAMAAVDPSDFSSGVARVATWHRRLFLCPLTVVLQGNTQACGELDQAAFELAHNFGLRVIVDAPSMCQLDVEASPASRSKTLEVGPMPRALLEQLPALAGLHAALKTAGLSEVVWACVGGCVADYHTLRCLWEDEGGGAASDADVGRVVAIFLQRVLSNAVRNVAKGDTAQAALYATFVGRVGGVPHAALKGMAPDRSVLRTTWQHSPTSGSWELALAPVDAATALVLRHGLKAAPTVTAVKRLLEVEAAPPPPPVLPPSKAVEAVETMTAHAKH